MLHSDRDSNFSILTGFEMAANNGRERSFALSYIPYLTRIPLPASLLSSPTQRSNVQRPILRLENTLSKFSAELSIVISSSSRCI